MFWENFINICNKRGLKPTPIIKAAGLASSSIARWQEGAAPNGDSLIKLAKYLNCSIDYLLTGNEFNKSVNFNIKNQELEMIELYHLLPEQTKELVCDLIKLLYEKDSKSKKSFKKITIDK